MLNIEYEVKLNESGRPYVELSPDYENKPEHNFFVVEMTRYLLITSLNKRSEELDADSILAMKNTIDFLGQISDEIAEILWHDMKNMGDIELIFGKKYHVIVDTIEERDKLEDDILMNGKIYKKQDGLKVFIAEENKIYELKNNIWIEL
jgi:hypothetical protein